MCILTFRCIYWHIDTGDLFANIYLMIGSSTEDSQRVEIDKKPGSTILVGTFSCSFNISQLEFARRSLRLVSETDKWA